MQGGDGRATWAQANLLSEHVYGADSEPPRVLKTSETPENGATQIC